MADPTAAGTGEQTHLLTRDQLVKLSGFSPEELEKCEADGIIRADGGRYRPVELIKLQLMRQVAEQSGGLDHVLEQYRRGGYSMSYVEMLVPLAQQLSTTTYREALERFGLAEEEMVAVMRAAGLPIPVMDQPARADELDAFERYSQLRSLPIPLEARLHALRVTADSMRRAAEVQSELFRAHVADPLSVAYKDRLDEGNALIGEISERANPTVAALTLWLYQRYLEHEVLKSVTIRMEAAVQSTVPVLHRGDRDPAVAFVDLTGFTVLSADGGDEQAAELAQKFNDLLLDITLQHRGKVVKTMGDGAMLFFDQPRDAVRAGLKLCTEMSNAGLPPLRVGINRGPVVAQSGDYYGTTINVASRITDYARPHEVLISSMVAADTEDAVALEEIGEVTLKGVAQPVRLFRAREAAQA